VDRPRTQRVELDVGVHARIGIDLGVDQMKQMPKQPFLAAVRGWFLGAVATLL
jgi:hypothetical protein